MMQEGVVSPTQQDDGPAPSPMTRKPALIVLYSLLLIFYGYLDSTGSTLSAPIMLQLESSYVEYANIYLYFGIGSLMSAIISSFVVDAYESSHNYIAFVVVSASIASCLMPSTLTVQGQCILWFVIGSCYGSLGAAVPVYIFRAWPGNASSYFFAFLCVFGVQKAVMPIFIELTILHFGFYGYALFAMSAIGILFGGLAVILPTPKHDELRSVRNILSTENSARSATEIFKALEQKQSVLNLLVALFGVIVFLFRGTLYPQSTYHRMCVFPK